MRRAGKPALLLEITSGFCYNCPLSILESIGKREDNFSYYHNMKTTGLFPLVCILPCLSSGSPELQITETDDYNQWEEAKTAKAGADPASFYKLPGFKVELLRSAGDDEGSWVSCTFDPQGRLSIGREDEGILRYTFSDDRLTITHKEWLLKQAKEPRGLLYAHGALYVNANKSSAIYRFRDLDGDGLFEEETKLFDLPGGRGHGRNGLALGPDGLIYAIMGDSVKLPYHIEGIRDHTSPLRRLHKPFRPNEGHVFRFDKDGKQPAIFAAGLRNPYGIAFNTDGELFTFDADAEHDMGAPWYRPTQIKHLTSGADFGWRAVTGSWPPYYPDHPDNTPALVDLGKSSPTGVISGWGSHFPTKYKQALYALDWTYGRIIAVHLTPNGASYTGEPEVFLRGRPLNLTDAAIGSDGAMYFVTGGRGTQSALYRVAYTLSETPLVPPVNKTSAKLRGELKSLEEFHQKNAPPLKLPSNLDDPHIRHAARVAIEFKIMRGQQFTEEHVPDKSLLALANANLGIPTTPNELIGIQTPEVLQIHRTNLPKFSVQQKDSLRDILRKSKPADYGNPWEYTSLMIDLGMPEGTSHTLSLLQSATNQRDRMHYLRILATASAGWDLGLRRQYFEELANAKTYLGGRGMPTFIKKIREDALATLSEEEKVALGDLIKSNPVPKPPPLPDLSHRKFVKAWTMQDFPKELPLPRDTSHGQKLFNEGLCSRCHRFGSHGYTIGPDLTQVSSRLNSRDLLQAILEPSKSVAENYQTHEVILHDGKIVHGQIIPQADYRSRKLLLAPNPLEPSETIEIPKGEIESHRRSPNSFMPPSLLNSFSKEEVLALVAWLGNPK